MLPRQGHPGLTSQEEVIRGDTFGGWLPLRLIQCQQALKEKRPWED
jgi:hypothetical protein